MEALTFIAELVKALAWPLTLAVILFSLRHSITALIPGLRKLKWKELEFEFQTELKEVKAAAEHIIPEPVQRLAAESTQQSEELQLVRISPRASISMAWSNVRRASTKALTKRGYETTPFPQTSSYIGKMLREYDVLDADALAVYEQLSKLRYNVIFNDEFRITQKEAQDYILTATALARYIDSKT